ncbi:MAG: SRPBCC family protein [Acidobacteriia bacterium]|jgi:hypothetical protein|nr:SRPBCC family protein [Terriglobia bacterium]
MAALQFGIEIAASADRVWAFFLPQRMPLWYGPEMDIHLEVSGGAGEFAVGQKVRISGRLGRREVSLTAVVTGYERLRRLEWRFSDRYGVRGRQRWMLYPVTAETTRLHMEDVYTLPGRLGWIADLLLVRWSVRSRDRRWLSNLRRLAERVPTRGSAR